MSRFEHVSASRNPPEESLNAPPPCPFHFISTWWEAKRSRLWFVCFSAASERRGLFFIQRCRSDAADVLKHNGQRGIFTNTNDEVWEEEEVEKKRRWRRSSWFTCDDHDEVSAASLRMIIPLSVTSAQEPGLSSNRLRGSCERTDKNCFQQQTQLLQLTRTPTCSRKVTRSKRRFSLRLCALCLQPHDRNTRKTSSCLMSQWRKVRNLLYQPVKHD